MESKKTMEAIKQELKESISSAFDKWSQQYYHKQITKKSSGLHKVKEEIRYEDLFLSKRVFILGFMRYVTKQALSNPVITKQKSVLLRTILKSIISSKGFTIKELDKGSQYTRRHTQRLIHEVLSDAFIDLNNQHKDERFISHSTVFAPHQERQEPFEMPQEFFNVLGKIPVTPETRKWHEIHSRIRIVTPEYLTELLDFRDKALDILKEIGYSTDEGKVLYQELKMVSEIQQIFHNHLQSIMAVIWWRSRREKTKKKLLQDGFPWKYTKKDAEQASELLYKITESREHTFNVLIDSGVAMIETNLHDSAEIIFKEAVKNEEGPPVFLGITHENLGVYHRRKNNPKLMIQEMKKAVEHYKKSDNKYRLSVGLKNLAEAQWMYGYLETAKRYYEEAAEIANQLDREDKANLFGNLAVSAMRVGNKQMEIKYLTKYIVSCPDEWTERILNANQRLSEIM